MEEMQQIAWKAARRFRSMAPMFSSFASSMAGSRVTVTAGDGTFSSPGRIIVLPPLALGMDYKHNQTLCFKRNELGMLECPACAAEAETKFMVFHEIGHLVGQSDAHPMRNIPYDSLHPIMQQGWWGSPDSYLEWASVFPMFQFLLNICEDVRIEELITQARPGLARDRDASYRGIMRTGIELPDGSHQFWRDAPLNGQACIWVLYTGSGLPLHPGDLAESIMDLSYDADLLRLVQRLRSALNVHEIFLLANDIWREMRKHDLLLPPEDVKVPPPPTPESDDESGDSQPDGEESGQGNRSPESGEDSSGGGGASPDDEGSTSEETDSDDGAPDERESTADQSSGDGEGEDGEEAEAEGGAGDSDSESDEAGADADGVPGGEPGEADDGTGEALGQDGVPDEVSDGAPSAGPGVPSSGDRSGRDERGDSLPEEQAAEQAEGGLDAAPDDDGPDGTARPADPAPAPTGPLDGPDDGQPDVPPTPDDRAPDGDSTVPDDWYTNEENLDKAREQYVLDHGTDDEVGDMLEKFQHHQAKPDAYETEVLSTAVNQATHFDAPSVLKGVEVVQTDAHDYFGTEPNRQANAVHEVSLGETNVAGMRMKRRLEKIRLTKIERNLKRGKPDANKLGKRAPVNDPRLFVRKTVPGKEDHEFLIALDISGSTSQGRVLAQEKEALLAQADVLHKLGLKFAVVAHSATRDKLHIVHVKEFDQPWDDRARFRLLNLKPTGFNLDGHAFEYLRKMIEPRKAAKRCIIYYSDGKMPNANYAEELEVLLRELDITKRLGISVQLVELFLSSMNQYGIPAVQFKSHADILAVVDGIADRLDSR